MVKLAGGKFVINRAASSIFGRLHFVAFKVLKGQSKINVIVFL